METTNLRWSESKKSIVCFFTIYFFFLVFDFTSSDELFPHFVYVIFSPLTSFWHWLVPWTGEHILRLSYPITVRPNGSGDTTYNYVLQLLWIVLALLIAVCWSVIDRKRPAHRQLYFWLRIFVRYYFAFILFVYGFIKVFKLQFPFPSLVKMAEPFGNSSPMGLAWSFVGYSNGYNIFIGMAEVLAGLLLLHRRTVLLGSLLALSIMINVAAMNFMYDIPVKIFSTNLIVLSAFLAAHDWKRVVGFFFLNKPVMPEIEWRPSWPRWARITRLCLKGFFIVAALYSTCFTYWQNSMEYGDNAPKPPMYGIHEVESFSINSTERPPLTTDSVRWKRIIINFAGSARVSTMRDSASWMKLDLDTVKRTFVLSSFRDSTDRYDFSYTEPDPEHILFIGKNKSDSFRIQTRRFNLNNFRLISRDFHWINEQPYNR